ncbi:uncharacterized protein [Nicotiana sylvestris]|uniref:uncharacterized protein n=1 Tax=Nicotiana sylvestris TaxID=4096 RepID=UPI00388CAA5B
MDEEDAEKTSFTTPWGTYCYRVMPFVQKNAGATYMRAMTAIFHDIMHQEIKVYVDDKDAAIKWKNECQEAFDKIKKYLSNPPVLVPLEPERPLFLYLTVLENSFGCVIGQHDVTGKKEQAIYYLSKKFTSYESKQHVEDLGKRFKSIEFRYIPRCHNQLADALATFASMLPYPAITLKSFIKKAVVDFVHSNLICHFGIPATIITDSAANLNSHLMGEIYEQFKITHRNSTPYRPKANGAIEAANKNIKKILRKMIQSSRQWHEKLTFALLGYRTMVRTSIGATPYLLVYGTEAVIPVEVEIHSLRIIVEAEIEDSDWVKTRLEQLTLIDEKRMAAVCHRQLYQQRMARDYNKKVFPRGAGFEMTKRMSLNPEQRKEEKEEKEMNSKC